MGAGELIEEAGFAHPWLTDDRDELAMAGMGPFQGLAQGLQFRLSPHEAAETAGCHSLQASPGRHSPH
jgi:hypothetical protein